MKNLFFLFSLITLITITNACKKDNFEVDQVDNTIVNSSNTNRQRSCGMTVHMEKLLQDPAYQRLQKQKLDRVKNMVSSRTDCASPTILPIAVHFQGVSNPDFACLRTLAQTQIDILNNDYQGTNSDILNWTNNAAVSFPGISNGEGCFKFCIATKNHPNSSGLNNGEPAVTVNATNGDFDTNWSGYINIFVQSNTGLLGYSPLGGSGNGDGVVIDATAFGSGNGCGSITPGAPYNLGRTLTHEMGHYLLLDHIWGDGCGTDDLVSDTPESNEPYYDCPSIGASTCSSIDMHMNYMDYTNDACMYMFSEGQVNRSNNYINSSLSIVTNNASNVCEESGGNGGGGGNQATCDDGILNGHETGIDCGGPDCSPCVTPPTGCTAPGNFQVNTVSENSANISWTSVNEASAYSIEFRPEGGEFSYNFQVTSNIVTLSALASGTSYEIKVKSICTEGTSDFSTASFTTDDHGCTDSDCAYTPVGMQLSMDDYGSETSWELYDQNQLLIAEGGGYDDEQAGIVIQESFCLEDGCYEFVLYDAFGDGICCDYGEGFLQLINEEGQIVAESDGYFGEYTSVEFCITDGLGGESVNRLKTSSGQINSAVMQRSKNQKGGQ